MPGPQYYTTPQPTGVLDLLSSPNTNPLIDFAQSITGMSVPAPAQLQRQGGQGPWRRPGDVPPSPIRKIPATQGSNPWSDMAQSGVKQISPLPQAVAPERSSGGQLYTDGGNPIPPPQVPGIQQGSLPGVTPKMAEIFQRMQEGNIVGTAGHTPAFSTFIGGPLNVFGQAATVPGTVAKNIWDFFTVPEGGATATPEGQGGDYVPYPKGAAPQGQDQGQDIFSYPAPPNLAPYQEPAYTEPAYSAGPKPTPYATPDYSAYEKFMEQAAPHQDPRDWQKYRMNQALLGLALGANRWDPRSGWGGLLSGAMVGAGANAMYAREKEMESQDEFTKAMRQYALQRAAGALDIAGQKTRAQNLNIEQQNVYAQRQAAGEQERQQRIAIADHEKALREAQAKRKEDEAQRQDEAGTYQYSDEGVTVTRKEGDKITAKFYPKNLNIAQDKNLEKLKKEWGDRSERYKRPLWYKLFSEGDPQMIRQQMATDIVDNGQGTAVYGDKYTQIDKAVREIMTSRGTPENKPEWYDEYKRLMALHLSPYTNVNSRQFLNAAMPSSIGAVYMIQEAPGGTQSAQQK